MIHQSIIVWSQPTPSVKQPAYLHRGKVWWINHNYTLLHTDLSRLLTWEIAISILVPSSHCMHMMTSSNGNITVPLCDYWPFVRGIHRSPVNSPHRGQWRGALMFFLLICAWINGWVNKRKAGDLRRHRVHHGVTVMTSVRNISMGDWSNDRYFVHSSIFSMITVYTIRILRYAFCFLSFFVHQQH